MVMTPGAVVDPIARQPLPFGLFSVLTPRTSGARWESGGIVWEPLSCAPASGLGDPSCDPDVPTPGLPYDFPAGAGTAEADVFSVYGSYECTPVGHTLDYATTRATEHLIAREEARVERALWTGDLFGPGGQNGFAEGAASVGTALPIDRAVAKLELWLAQNYGSLGTMHMNREAALMAAEQGVLETVNNQLRTKLGTPVVAGAGYPGTGPTGQAPAANATFIYATPALGGYRSEVYSGSGDATGGFDRANNTLSAVASRSYAVGWDPCGTAVANVNLEA